MDHIFFIENNAYIMVKDPLPVDLLLCWFAFSIWAIV